MTEAAAPRPSFRLIPSRFPPIGLFDTVSTIADAAAVMELAGWTNDRLVLDRIARLAASDWVYGRPNSSVIMAAFLHAAPSGTRFNTGDLGAWYAAATIATAAAEVGHHLRREAFARGLPGMARRYRTYNATLLGTYLDLRGQRATQADLLAPDSYLRSQIFGERVRATGGNGLIYDSVRHTGGINIVAYRPRHILDVVQTDHYEISTATNTNRIDIHKL
ncbi:RES family NAD+ phosphorylase [Lichenicoccus sp.]|uniref:RES family NAD+ phosphorylase n=1 Tax=Lichenicoccus sp. TaxID=2781899 RepID=UPI003D140518